MNASVLTLVLLSCSVLRAADPAGHYVLSGVMEVGSELLLKPNGSFEYMLAYGAADYFAKGTWRLDKDAVVLNTEGKEEPPFRLLKSASTKSPVLRIWVKAPNGRPVEHIEALVETEGREVTQSTSEEGVAAFPNPRAAKSVTLRVRVYHVEAGPFPIDPANNEMYFEINGDAITRVPFKNERLKIDGTTLEMRYWDKDRVMRYRKED